MRNFAIGLLVLGVVFFVFSVWSIMKTAKMANEEAERLFREMV